MWGLWVRHEDRVSFLEVPSSYSNAYGDLWMARTSCTSQSATSKFENGDVWNRAHSCRMNAWIALVGCMEGVWSVTRQNARANIELAMILQKLQCWAEIWSFGVLECFRGQAFVFSLVISFWRSFVMMPSPPFIRCTSSLYFCNFSCFLRKVKWLKPTFLNKSDKLSFSLIRFSITTNDLREFLDILESLQHAIQFIF